MERYDVKLDTSKLVSEVDRLWDALDSDETLREDAGDAGIDLDQLAGLRRAELLRFESPGHGIDAATLLDVFTVSAASGAQLVAYDLWKRVLLPRLQKQFGKDAIKARKPEAEAPAKKAAAAGAAGAKAAAAPRKSKTKGKAKSG